MPARIFLFLKDLPANLWHGWFEVNRKRIRLTGMSSIEILIVEDDILSMGFMVAHIEKLGHNIHQAEDGEQALEYLRQNPDVIDVVLMDREMPNMDGLSAVQHMKADPALQDIPVIMVTGADSDQQIREGIEAGVFYYLIKPVDGAVMASVLDAALRENRQRKSLSDELGKHLAALPHISQCECLFQTLDEAEELAVFIAHLYPDPQQVLGGVVELLVNTIEHGNLGVGYERKTALIDSGQWQEEINRLARLPENRHKFAKAVFERKDDAISLTISDCGPGFDWERYMEIDFSRITDNHGRGIAQANLLSFNRLQYNEAGNTVTAYYALNDEAGEDVIAS